MRPDEAGPEARERPGPADPASSNRSQTHEACRSPRYRRRPGRAARPDDEAQKRAIANAVWTDLLWLMPPDRTVTIAVTGGDVAVELGPPGPAPEVPAH